MINMGGQRPRIGGNCPLASPYLQRCETDSYPSLNDIETRTSILPPSLMLLMECLIKNPLKQASIGQCLLKAMKPNSVIPPLWFTLRVEINHAIGSASLLIELSKWNHPCWSINFIHRSNCVSWAIRKHSKLLYLWTHPFLIQPPCSKTTLWCDMLTNQA